MSRNNDLHEQLQKLKRITEVVKATYNHSLNFYTVDYLAYGGHVQIDVSPVAPAVFVLGECRALIRNFKKQESATGKVLHDKKGS